MKKTTEAFLPTKFGKFRVHVFVEDGKEHLALVKCSHMEHKAVPVRIHSKCFTGDTLNSLRCDCRNQLEASLRYIERKGCGILIYLDQEGRGIGLVNKIRAYALQDEGLDTVEANVHLGFCEDMRDYSAAVKILQYFGVNDVALLTNNPEKINSLKKYGINVKRRIPLITKITEYNKKYLQTKKKKMNHIL